MVYELPKLNYQYNAFEPHIDARTMEIHHSKHHLAYINNANKAMESVQYTPPTDVVELLKNLKNVPESIRQTVRNNAGGHANHAFFWQILSPSKSEPSGKLLKAINDNFGSFSAFKEKFSATATSHFASGWAWLYKKTDNSLAVTSTPYHDSPWMTGFVPCEGTPLLVIDLWEHAYYLNYQNRRADFVNAFWNVINWPFVESLL